MYLITSPTVAACRATFVLFLLSTCLLVLLGCSSKEDAKVLLNEDIGLKTLAGCTPLILSGSALPASFEDDFSTGADDQSAVELHLYAGGAGGGRRDLTVFVIDQIAPAPKGMP